MESDHKRPMCGLAGRIGKGTLEKTDMIRFVLE
jgi:hypothetical protein